jgi:dihydroflavonol-4-reductase
MLEKVTGRSGPRARIPYPVAFVYAAVSAIWAKLTGGETLVTVEAVRMMQARLAVTSAKAEQELGWKHRPLRETLADEVAWYRAQGLAAEPAARATAVTA